MQFQSGDNRVTIGLRKYREFEVNEMSKESLQVFPALD